MLNEIHKDFSPKLRAFMGEWATYFVINSYKRLHALADISDSEFFKIEKFEVGLCGAFDETYHYFHELCLIMKIDQQRQFEPKCLYEDVWETVYSKFQKPKDDNIPLFFDCAHDWHGSPLTSSEAEAFTIDNGCKPLFAQLESEGYVLSTGDNYFWSSKIRPYFEFREFWKPKVYEEENNLELSIIDNLEQPDVDALHKIASEGGIPSAVLAVQKSSVFRSVVKTHRLKSYEMAFSVCGLMFPNLQREKEHEPLHWKWYGEISSQGSLL